MSIFSPHIVDTLARLPDWLDEHFTQLRDIRKAVEDSVEHEHYERLRNNVTLDGSGNGTITFDVPQGYDWSLERITVTSTGNGLCQLYLNAAIPQETIEIIGSSQLYSDGFANNVFVSQGAKLLVVFTNAGANGVATVNLQVKLLKRAEKAVRTLKAYDE